MLGRTKKISYANGFQRRPPMKESEDDTRADRIDPKLKESGWGTVEGSKIRRNVYITDGKIQVGGGRGKRLFADYVLFYKGKKLAVVEAKSIQNEVGEGVAQAKNYALRLNVQTTYAANGKEIYQICMESGIEGPVDRFPTPDELWRKTFALENIWRDRFTAVPYETISGTKPPRYYQENAVEKTLDAISEDKDRILLTLATGTGKTTIAFHIAWKLFQTRWNKKQETNRRPRILFLADRNILADQAMGEFTKYGAFKEDAMVRIDPSEIRKKGTVPTNGNIFFTIFQTFMSGDNNTPYFGEYPKDFFDFIIIDECHRGGANDEGNWRGILDYFSPAVQLGLTATPKRKDNVDTYKYFKEPVYIYSLKEGIEDGFLTPFRIKRIQTTIDDYIYTSDDRIIEGEVTEGKLYREQDFNKTIEIKEREEKRVDVFLKEINQKEKGIVFCASQPHAALIRDLINQKKESRDPFYCVRVTAFDGEMGEQYLRDFQDNEKTIPTVLTTSQKLSTGVDARNIRNIILLRPINSMIEFKQIVGRGTRLFEGKNYFTIYDFVNAYQHFADPEWDGEPVLEVCPTCEQNPCTCVKTPPPLCTTCGQRPCQCEKTLPEPCPRCEESPCVCVKKVKIKLRDGKAREIQHMMSTSFWSADGRPISAEEFVEKLYGTLPDFFKSEEELRKIWSNPMTRKTLLDKLSNAGYGMDTLSTLQTLINAEKSDIFDVLEYVSFAIAPMTREDRVKKAKANIFALLNEKQKEFLDFVLSKYIETGVEELEEEKLPALLELKYHTMTDAANELGDLQLVKKSFIDFQKFLYEVSVA